MSGTSPRTYWWAVAVDRSRLVTLLVLTFLVQPSTSNEDYFLFRSRRAVTARTVSPPNTIPENVNNDVMLFNLSEAAPNRNFVITGNSANLQNMFQVTAQGELRLASGLSQTNRKLFDYDKFTTFNVIVNATSRTDPTDVQILTVQLPLSDVNDEDPMFTNEPKPLKVALSETTLPGTVIYTLTVLDKDTNSDLEFLPLQSDPPSTRFTRVVVDATKANIVIAGNGQFTTGSEYMLTATVRDKNAMAGTSQSASESIYVKVGYVEPQFYQNSYAGQIFETATTGRSQVLVKDDTSPLEIKVKKFVPGSTLSFEIQDNNRQTSQFRAVQNAQSSSITLVNSQPIDYETTKSFSLTVRVTESGSNLNSTTQVIITVLDENDHSPTFSAPQYSVDGIKENLAIGASVLSVSANDLDDGLNSQLVFSIPDTNSSFQITTQPAGAGYNGIISVKRNLDYDKRVSPTYKFSVQVSDRGTPPRSTTVQISVTVVNVNDNDPVIDNSTSPISISENAEANFVVTIVQAKDEDGDGMTFSFQNGPTDQIFRIDRDTGRITLTQPIPATIDSYALTVVARDDGSCCGLPTITRSSEALFIINIADSNANKPTFENCFDYDTAAQVKEKANVGTLVIKVSATDPDRGENGRVEYEIRNPDPNSPNAPFAINSTSGSITVKNNNIERGQDGFMQVTVVGFNPGPSPRMEGWCTFRVTIIDINDNPPVFSQNRYDVEVSLLADIRSVVRQMQATDKDVGPNANITYSFEGNSQLAANNTFSIDRLTGTIRLNATPQLKSYTLIVVANDNGIDPYALNGSTTVVVTVNSEDRQPPRFTKQPTGELYVDETAERNTVITTISCVSNAVDPKVEFRVFDASQSITEESAYFRAGTFNVSDANSMNLILSGSLDYNRQKRYQLSIVCQSFGGVVLRSLIEAVINVRDTNNQVPTFQGLSDINGRYSGSVAENAAPGSTVCTVTANDKDETSPFNVVTFSLADNANNYFSIIELGGNRAVVVTTANLNLDRETKNRYDVSVIAKDGAPAAIPVDPSKPNEPNTAQRYITVEVTDINDSDPSFAQAVYKSTVEETASVGNVVFSVTATDPDLIDQEQGLSYDFTSGNFNKAFSIQASTGQISVSRKLDYESPTDPKIYNMTLTAYDQNRAHSATTIVEISVLDMNDNRPIFTKSDYVISNMVTEEDTSISAANPLFLEQLTATDADVGRVETKVYYSLLNSGNSQLFKINETSGQLYLIGVLDRDGPSYTVTVEAKDERINPLISYANVQVIPMDINDNAPVFDEQYLIGTVAENSPAGTSVMVVLARDKDQGNNGTVNYAIPTTQPTPDRSGLFTITGDKGQISIKTSATPADLAVFDREQISEMKLVVAAHDLGTPNRLTSTATVTIHIGDKNDESPYFERPMYNITMSEVTSNNVIYRVPAIDNDSDPKNKDLTFSLIGSPEEKATFFVSTEGQDVAAISVGNPIDYEKGKHTFNFILNVTDNFPGHYNTTNIWVFLEDYNDNPPVFNNSVETITLIEEEAPYKEIAQFFATDADSGINAEFEYSIVRSSDPRYEFYIHPQTGKVYTRKRLDREVEPVIYVTIMAKDKGEIPLNSTAQLIVKLTDINDNAPSFLEDYQPQVPENEPSSNRLVVEVFAMDPDTLPFGPPFGFMLPPGCSVPACTHFELTVNSAGNRSAKITTNSQFDREAQKQYFLPIIMWDMFGKGDNRSQTATNTLTITIGDKNDNKHKPGHQDIWVYNFGGSFGNVDIGRVYAEDPDDWDLPDKQFTDVSPATMKNYFTVNPENGMISMLSNVPANVGQKPYVLKVNVFDTQYKNTELCTVSITVEELTDEAIRKSGSVRLAGISAEDFVKPQATGDSRYTLFRQQVSSMLGYPSLNSVEIVSLTDGPGYVDVRFAAHGSPYLNPSQMESAIMLNQADFENNVGVTVDQVPVNLCMEEVYDDGCFTYFNVTGQPQLVNANGTSYVVMKTNMVAESGCVDSMFPEPQECRGDYCFNGGTCMQDDWGKLSCQCLAGFDGPRCQQRRHSFDGTSAAFYKGLSVCAEGRTSIEFITEQSNGLIMYSGPINNIDPMNDPKDFLVLELKDGYPKLRLNLGEQDLELAITGKDQAGAVVMNPLNDGQWHHIDIDRNGQNVVLTVDHCTSAKSSNNLVTDWTPCRKAGSVGGSEILLNVASLLQLGGRFPRTPPSYPAGVTTAGFVGCVRNLVHNTKLYDLHYKTLPSWNSGANGCPREEQFCLEATSAPVCGVNSMCQSSWNSGQITCRCDPGYYGDKCQTEAPATNLLSSSFYKWELTNQLINEALRETSIQMMFRTRQTEGMLFSMTNAADNTILLQIDQGRLLLSVDLGSGEKRLALDNAQANTGQWHTVRVERYGNEFILSMDGGEGRNMNYQVTRPNLPVDFRLRPYVSAGARVLLVAANDNQIADDLKSTCLRDIRVNDHWLPVTTSQNNDAYAKLLGQPQNTEEGCTREDCVGVTCGALEECYPLWELWECRCIGGYYREKGVCVSMCIPNPCENNGVCSIKGGSYSCACTGDWSGTNCNVLGVKEDDAGVLAAGEIAGIVIGCLLLLILVILLVLLLFLKCRRKEDEKMVLEVDPDDDFIRENVMFYDEEGAGEEDHDAYDITLLQRPGNGMSDFRPNENPDREDEMGRGKAPVLDTRPPGVERPDVGNFINDRIKDTENDDPDADTPREFNYEGGNSDAGSLSSLNTSSSDGSQDYDYLNNWGPKFAKLADMYGAGQNDDDNEV